MLRARIAASVLVATVAAVFAAAPALATTSSAQKTSAAQVRADDPCEGEHKVRCQQLPEAPNPLLYPAAGTAALILFVAFERRRRKRSTRTQA